MPLRISVPKSHIYEWYIGGCSCPKCGELLSAPAYSEFLKRNNVRHSGCVTNAIMSLKR
jgi:hypothetical protein